MKPIKLSECDEGAKIALPSWQNGQKYRVVYRVCEPTTITRCVTKIVEGVKKRQRVEIPARWLSHMEPGAIEAGPRKRRGTDDGRSKTEDADP